MDSFVNDESESLCGFYQKFASSSYFRRMCLFRLEIYGMRFILRIPPPKLVSLHLSLFLIFSQNAKEEILNPPTQDQ